MRTAELAWRQALFCAASGRHPGRGLVAQDLISPGLDVRLDPSGGRRFGSSVVQDRKAQLAEARGVGDRFDLDDLAA